MSTVIAVAITAFSCYLLLIDGAATAIFMHKVGNRLLRDSYWPLGLVTGVRILVEFVAGLIALFFLSRIKSNPPWKLFCLFLSVFCLLGVGEMLFYTGALDEHHFLLTLSSNNRHLAAISRALLGIMGITIYSVSLLLLGRRFYGFSLPLTQIIVVAFIVPLILIDCRFLALSEMRTNIKEYARFMIYYAGGSLGLFAIPYFAGSGTPEGNEIIERNGKWIARGTFAAILFILQDTIRNAIGISWF